MNVIASWDAEAQVWVAVSEDIPGLVTESPSLQMLVGKLQALIPEICELNKHLMADPVNRVSITADYERFKEELGA